MEKEKLDDILALFVSDDTDKEPLMKPFPTREWMGREWVCATDAHVLILAPYEFPMEYRTSMQIPDPISIMPDVGQATPIVMRILKDAISRVAILEYDPQVKCRDCDGDGTFRHGMHMYDCQNCNETGVVNGSGPKVNEFDRDARIMLGETMFAPELFNKVVSAMEKIGGEPKIVCQTRVKVIFECGGYYIAIMGQMQSDDDRDLKKIHV